MSLDLASRTDPEAIAIEAIPEARRQIEICNACRYCEGFCAVFPAINRERAFADGDVTQLANLCHNCRGCYYSCQYTPPHDYAVNLPAVLNAVRVESWEALMPLPAVSRALQRHGTATALATAAGLAAAIWAVTALGGSGTGFYAALSHAAMVAIFLPAFVLPLAVVAVGLQRYWRTVGGDRVSWPQLRAALADTARLRNLSGGQGQGCNFEEGDRYSDARRYAHQAAMWGFLLCFASTVSGTVLHYGFASEAPYPFWSVPKLLGVPGGLLLVAGCVALVWLKGRADRTPEQADLRGGEYAFVILLGLTGLTGLLLYAATGTGWVPALLAVHLGTVLAFFLTLPWSKMAHGFFRLAALVRDAQIKGVR